MYRSFLLIVTGLLLAAGGCVQQEISVVLRKDGSGTYHVKRILSEEESLLEGEEDASDSSKTEETFSHITRNRKICDSKDQPGRRIEDTTYTFKQLGSALPELENEIVMGPRFTVRGDRFVVFLNREKQEYDGIRSTDDEGKGFYTLTVEFPVTPTSDKGTVNGNSVT